MNVIFHKNFKKQYKKRAKKEREKFDECLRLFMNDPYNPILNNHSLYGKYKEFRSINITGDLRTLYKSIEKDTVLFIMLDIHSSLYS